MPGSATLEQLAQSAGITLRNSRELYPEQHHDGDEGLSMLVVDNALGRAVIALQGAHLMSFRAAGQAEMLWLSPRTALAKGTPIRGGIPLCLPWFGPGPDGKSMHGFARTRDWSLTSFEKHGDGTTNLVLELGGDASTCALWPHAFAFRLEVCVGSTLRLTLGAKNLGNETAPLAFAFHTYFAVPDVAQVVVGGLAGATYIDKMDNFARKVQQGEPTISAVTDRIYLDVGAKQTLTSGTGLFTIEGDARCAVLWNAWTNDKTIADMGEGNHVGYLCLERGDVADRAPTLPPGSSYHTTMTLAYA
jgi:glucose-6-phosphate 1-epimerase